MSSFAKGVLTFTVYLVAGGIVGGVVGMAAKWLLAGEIGRDDIGFCFTAALAATAFCLLIGGPKAKDT